MRLLHSISLGICLCLSACNLADPVGERPVQCQEGAVRGQEVCRQGRWRPVMQQDLGQGDMAALVDMRVAPDLGALDMSDMQPLIDSPPDMPDMTDMSGVVDMPADMEMGCVCTGAQVCLAGRCATRVRVPNPSQGSSLRFGASVAVYGDWLAVGAPGVGRVEGKVYLFNRSSGGWLLVETFKTKTSAFLRPGAGFGQAISMSQTLLAIGSPSDKGQFVSDEGAVYIYELKDAEMRWRLLSRESDRNSNSGDRLGASVDVLGSQVLVGAPGEDTLALNDAGKALRFDCSSSACASFYYPGTRQDARKGAQVGSQVAFLPGGRGVFSAPEDSTMVLQGGSLKIWGALSQTDSSATFITPAGLEAKERFGAALSTDMRSLVVGAPGRPFQQSEQVGRAYVYDAQRLSALPQVIETPGVGALQRFGEAVAVRDTLLAVGAPGALRGEGQVHLFGAGVMGFVYDQALIAAAGFGGEFGAAIAIDEDGQTLVIGAPAEVELGGDEVGGVYVYTFEPKP